MSQKPVLLRGQARQDIEEAVDYYAGEAGEQVALRFIEAVENCYRAIASHPAAGSPRYAYELSLPGLRIWPLKKYPYLAFYIEQDDHIDIWRVLHAHSDIPRWMQESDEK